MTGRTGRPKLHTVDELAAFLDENPNVTLKELVSFINKSNAQVKRMVGDIVIPLTLMYGIGWIVTHADTFARVLEELEKEKGGVAP